MKKIRGFMLIEVLIALALFAISAVYLVEGAFIATKTMFKMKRNYIIDQELVWARSEILKENKYDELREGGEISAPTIGLVSWDFEAQHSEMLDLYDARINLSFEGNAELDIDGDEREFRIFLLRTEWANHSDFSAKRQQVLELKTDYIRDYLYNYDSR